MTKRLKTVVISLLVVCLCLALIIGGTYALFSDSVEVNNHLEAGTLKVGLYRVSYQECKLNDNGTLTVSTPDTERVDLSDTTTKDITLFNVSNAVPECWYEAKLEISNNGNVAFDYGMRMLFDESSLSDAQKALADQLLITVTVGQSKTEFYLNESGEKGDIALDSMLAGDKAQTIVVRASFQSNNSNNAAQEAAVSFDLQVYATQKTEA